MAAHSIPCPVERITGVWKFDRPALRVSEARSLPGHLLHFIASGSYELTVSGRVNTVSSGDVIYYYNYEQVLWRGKRSPVTFYSVGFTAPNLLPPSPGGRIMRLPALRRNFVSLYRHSLLPEGDARTFLLYADLASILARMTGRRKAAITVDSEWWPVENRVREHKRYRIPIPDILADYGKSYATLNRACRKATGKSIAGRLRELCLEEAKGLLSYSTLSVTEIAEHLGYPGIHEFSRDFKRHCGIPPTGYASGTVKRRFSSRT